jgi:hypothetical protein
MYYYYILRFNYFIEQKEFSGVIASEVVKFMARTLRIYPLVKHSRFDRVTQLSQPEDFALSGIY